jgi:hypothetical protein
MAGNWFAQVDTIYPLVAGVGKGSAASPLFIRNSKKFEKSPTFPHTSVFKGK